MSYTPRTVTYYHAGLPGYPLPGIDVPESEAVATVGFHVLHGFEVVRYSFSDREGRPLTVVTLGSSVGNVASVYEFQGS